MDGFFIVEQRDRLVASPAAAATSPSRGPTPFEHAPAPDRCTAADPLGRGKASVQWETASPHSRPEEEVLAAQMRSADQFGEAVMGLPAQLAGTLLPGRWLGFGSSILDGVNTLNEEGTDGLTRDVIIDAGAKILSDYLIRSMNSKVLRGTEPLLENMIKSIAKPGGSNPGGPVEGGPRILHSDRNANWSDKQNQIQKGVDNEERRLRVHPGTSVA
jgi:hypothetical protein